MEENDLMEIESEQQDQQQSPNPKQGSSSEMHAGSKTAEQSSSSSATGAPGTSINDGERDKPSQSSKPPTSDAHESDNQKSQDSEEESQDSEEEPQDSEEEESLNNPKLKKGQANLQLEEGLHDKDHTPEIISNNNNENNHQQNKSKSKSKNKSGKPPPSGTKPRGRKKKPPGVKSSKPPQKTRSYTQQEEEEDNGSWTYALKENGANKDARYIAQYIWDKWGRLYENCAKVFTWIKAVKSQTARKFLIQSSQADDGYYDIDRIEKVIRTPLKMDGFEVFFRVRFTNDAQTILWVPMTNLDPDLAHAYLWNLHNSGKTKTNEQCRSLADFCPENFSKKKQLATTPTRVSTRQQKTSANEEKDVVSFVTKYNNYVQVDEILSSSDFMTQKELTEGVEPVNLPEYPDPYYFEKMPPFDLKHLETRLARMQELILTKPFEQLNLMKAIYAAPPKETPSKRCCQCGEHHGLIACSSDRCRISLCFQCTEREIGNINKNVSDPHAAEEPPPSWIQEFICSECTDRSSYRKNASPQKLLAVIKFYALSPESFHLAAKEDMQRWTKTNNVYLGYNVVFLPLIMNLEMVHCFNAAGRFLTSLQKIAGFNLANILFLFDVHSNRNSMVNLPKADMNWQFGLKKSVDFFDTCLETLHKLKNITELTAPIAAVFYCCAAVEGSLLPLFLRYRVPFAHSLAVANVSDTKTMTEMLLTFLSAQRGTIREAFGPDFAKLFGSFLVEQLLQMEWISQDHLQLPMQSVASYSSPQEQTSSATVALPDAVLFENTNFAPSQDAYITPPRSPLFATPPSPSPPVVTPTPPSYSPPHVTPADDSSSETKYTLKRKKNQNKYLKKEHGSIIEKLIPSRDNSRTAEDVAKEIVECLTRDHFDKFELFLQKEDFQSTIRGRVYNSWTKQKIMQPKQQ